MTIPRRRDRTLRIALLVSLFFHLSAVTVFRIVIYFPRYDIEFVDVAIVQTAPPPEFREQLRVPSAEDAFERLADETVAEDASIPFPEAGFELPTLRFSELDLLRIGQQGLEVRSRYRELFEKPPADTWALFGRELDRIGNLLGPGTREADTPQPISRPAPGFEAYLEWLSPPLDRQALAVRGIEGLRGLKPDALASPITLIIRVNREGRVVGVLDPVGPNGDLVDEAVAALLQYRFVSVGEEAPAIHNGTILIRGAEDGR